MVALEELFTAESGDVPAVCKSLAEADQVSLEAVEVVGTAGEVKTEACADVIDDRGPMPFSVQSSRTFCQ